MEVITVSLIKEYLYCPNYLYFKEILGINQYLDNRYKIKKGQEIHKEKEIDKKYLRKKLGVKEVWKEEKMVSDKYGLSGVADEILLLENGEMAPLDYKFSKYSDDLFDTLKYQLIAYSLLIEDTFKKKVNRAFVVFTRDNNKLVEVYIKYEDKLRVEEICREINKIREKGLCPNNICTEAKSKDCCYNKICVTL